MEASTGPTPSGDLRIVEAQRCHLAVVLQFHKALYRDYHAALVPAPQRELGAYRSFEQVLRDDVEALIEGSGTHVLLAFRGDEALGYISGRVEVQRRRLLPRRAILEDFFVEASARSSGVGRALYEALVQRFRGCNCEVLETTTWPENHRARQFYRELGFAEVELRLRQRLEGAGGIG